jgi:hypothetical protein
MVSLTTFIKLSLKAFESVSSLSLAERASRPFEDPGLMMSDLLSPKGGRKTLPVGFLLL